MPNNPFLILATLTTPAVAVGMLLRGRWRHGKLANGVPLLAGVCPL